MGTNKFSCHLWQRITCCRVNLHFFLLFKEKTTKWRRKFSFLVTNFGIIFFGFRFMNQMNDPEKNERKKTKTNLPLNDQMVQMVKDLSIIFVFFFFWSNSNFKFNQIPTSNSLNQSQWFGSIVKFIKNKKKLIVDKQRCCCCCYCWTNKITRW